MFFHLRNRDQNRQQAMPHDSGNNDTTIVPVPEIFVLKHIYHQGDEATGECEGNSTQVVECRRKQKKTAKSGGNHTSLDLLFQQNVASWRHPSMTSLMET